MYDTLSTYLQLGFLIRSIYAYMAFNFFFPLCLMFIGLHFIDIQCLGTGFPRIAAKNPCGEHKPEPKYLS